MNIYQRIMKQELNQARNIHEELERGIMRNYCCVDTTVEIPLNAE